MSNPDTQLLTLLQPFGLNFREILQACLFHAARPPDLPYMEFCTAIAANLNERRGAATTPERVAAALDFMRDTADLDFVLPRDRPSPALQQFAPKLRAQGKGAAASPVIAACPAPGCGAALEQRVACSNAQFYDDAGGAQRGMLYCKECPDCKTQCFLNGYEVPPAAGGARARTPYPDAAHEHPYWEGFSRETVVAVKLLKRYTGELKWGFCSAGAGAKIFNYSNDLESRFRDYEGPADQRSHSHTARAALNPQRLQLGWLHYWARTLARETAGELLPGLDLRWPLDAQLEWLLPGLRAFLRAEFYEHLRTSTKHPACGLLCVLDGNAKLCRGGV